VGEIHIPGLFVYFSLLYALIGTFVTDRVGSEMFKAENVKQNAEAVYRLKLSSLRLNQFGDETGSSLYSCIASIMQATIPLIKFRTKLAFVSSFYGQIGIIIPLAVLAPKVFTAEVGLGTVMQTAAAFAATQNGLAYLINSYDGLARWLALSSRLTDFEYRLSIAAGTSSAILVDQNQPLGLRRSAVVPD
jgi:putative ATP-binding cassette transporter